jgi:hypothetical protein
MKISKESSMLNSINQKTPMLDEGEKKRTNTNWISSGGSYRNQPISHNNNPKCT